MKPDENDLESREDRAIKRYAPVLAITNAVLTATLSGIALFWAVSQERGDASQDAKIENLIYITRGQQQQINENRSEMNRSLREIALELRQMHAELAKHMADMERIYAQGRKHGYGSP